MVEIIHHVEINFFFFSVEIFKIKTCQSRLCRVKIFVEIVEICRVAVEICRDAVEICREILTRKYKNPCTSRSRSRQTVEKRQNFQISTNFSISIETNFWKPSRLSITLRLILFWRRDRESRSRPRRDRSRVSIETTSRQIETPMLRKKPFLSITKQVWLGGCECPLAPPPWLRYWISTVKWKDGISMETMNKN